MAAPPSALVTVTRARPSPPTTRARSRVSAPRTLSAGLRLVSTGSFNSLAELALITIQLLPSDTRSSTGEPWYTTKEQTYPDANGGWAFYVQQASTLSNPNSYYLITEWFYDGTMRTYKARIPNTAGPTVSLKDVLI